MGRKFELDDDTVLVVHDDGRVRRASLPKGIDPEHFRNVLAAVDVLYRREGVFPTVDGVFKLWNKTPKKTISTIFATSEFKHAIALRGISMDENPGLTEEQSMALLLLSDPTDRRTTSTKLKQIGVSMAKYHAWMRQPLFSTLLRERSEQNLGDAVPVALNRLVGNAEAGDQRAVEKLLEVTGRHNPQNLELQNARTVITSLVEIILKRVLDPDVRKGILNDLNAIGIEGPSATIMEITEGSTERP